MDTRAHTHHVLRPPRDLVSAYLADPEGGWDEFREGYLEALERRFADDPGPFEALAERARRGDVHLGCNCPTKRQPDVSRCHTVLALELMKCRFEDLEVRFP